MTNNAALSSPQRLPESLVPIIKDKPGYLRPTSISEAVSRNHEQTMVTIRKNGGFRKLIGWVKGRLIEVYTYLGGFDAVTEYQIQMLATRICSKYFWVTPNELDYFFLAFQNGEYGKSYVTRSNTVNPQDIMQGLISYEKDLLEARGIAEQKRMRAEMAAREAEEAKKPHGLKAWHEYCEKRGFDPSTHRIASFSLAKDMNKVLNPERDERGIIKNKEQ